MMSLLNRSILSLAVCLSLASGARAQSSKAYVVVDTRTKKILAERNSDSKLAVGDLTKVVSSCVALDWLDATGGDRTRLVTVSAQAVQAEGPNPLKLRAGDQISIRDAMFSSLLASDSVATFALAEALGMEMWRKDGGRARSAAEFFVGQMNALAISKGMSRSKFSNPHGADARRGQSYSTAADMARIAIYALEKPSFNFIVRQKQRDVAYHRGGQIRRFRVFNSNRLLGRYGCDGVKTGATAKSGECLMASARKPDKISKLEGGRYLRIPYHIVAVTLDSTSRFDQVAQLINKGFADYEVWISGDRVLRRDQMLVMPE